MSTKSIMKTHGYDHFQRLNYLSQLKRFAVSDLNNACLSSFYGNLLVNVAKKAVLKIHPEIKRFVCKFCKVSLIEGKTASVTYKSVRVIKSVIWKCDTCGLTKKIPVRRGYKLWTDKSEFRAIESQQSSDPIAMKS